MNNAAIPRMSDQVLACELRAAWAQVECDLRHNINPGRLLSNYIAALVAEQARRAGA
jgi:hypothetical protein